MKTGSCSGNLPESSPGSIWLELVQAVYLKLQVKCLKIFKSVRLTWSDMVRLHFSNLGFASDLA
jgi:hypothetical protein